MVARQPAHAVVPRLWRKAAQVRRAARQDANHGAIVEAFQKAGWHVEDMSGVGNGFPDLIAIKHGRVAFIEVKDGQKSPSRRRLTPDEEAKATEFAAAGAWIHVIESVEQALRLMQL